MKKAIAIILSIMLILAITLPAAAISTIAVKSIKLNNSKITLKVGQTSNLTVTFTPAKTTQKSLTYVTGNKKIATVSTTGKITGVSKGTTTITVYTLNKKIFAKCNVTVSQLAKPAKLEKVTFVFYGDKSKRMDELLNSEFNQKFRDEINTEVDVQYIPWGECKVGGKIDLMLAAGEDFDGTLTVDVPYYVAKKMSYDLTDVSNKYLPDLKKVMPKEAFDSFTIDNKLYAIPIGFKPTSEVFRTVCVRQDLLEEVGMTEIKTIEDLDKFYTLCKAKHPDLYATPDSWFGSYILRGQTDKNYTTYDTQSDYIIVDEDTGKLIPAFDTEEFKKHCDLYAKWYKNGLIPKDILTNKSGNLALFESGKFMSFRGTCGTTKLENEPNLKKNVPTANTKEYLLNAGKPKYKVAYSSTGFQVPVYSKKADRVAMVVNLLQKSQELVDFFTYGIKDKDYKLTNNKIEVINTDELFYQWMNFNVKISSFDARYPDDFIPVYKAWDDGALPSKKFGFSADLSSVKSEKAKLDAVYDELMKPMLAGLIDYDKGIDKLKNDMKAAGFDKYIKELQKQLDAFQATKK